MSLFRAALALAVVLAHSGCVYGNCMTGGMAAVQAFFVSLELMFYAVAPCIVRADLPRLWPCWYPAASALGSSPIG